MLLDIPLSDSITCFLPCCCMLTVDYVSPGDGKCVVCDSYVRPATLVRVCEECNYGSLAGRCVICGGVGVSDAFYCKECTVQEKDVSFRSLQHTCRWCFFSLRACMLLWMHQCAERLLDLSSICVHAHNTLLGVLQRDGCPKIINLGSARTDLFYERKRCCLSSFLSFMHYALLALHLY